MESKALKNPPWVDRVLNRHWDTIASKVGSQWMPTAEIGKRGKKHFAEYGCGHYGCVLPSSTEDYVFKVTSDPSEAAFVVAASQIAEWPDGVVKYLFVYQTPEEYRGRPVYVIAREEAHDVGGWLKLSHSDRSVWRALERLRVLKEWAALARDKILKASNIRTTIDSVQQYSEWAEESVEWEAALQGPLRMHSWLKGAQAAAFAVRSVQIVAQEMVQEDVGYLVGEAIDFYIEHGMLLADVHANNIGRALDRGDRGSGLWVITDPGHMVPLKTKWLDLHVPVI